MIIRLHTGTSKEEVDKYFAECFPDSHNMMASAMESAKVARAGYEHEVAEMGCVLAKPYDIETLIDLLREPKRRGIISRLRGRLR